MSLRADTTSLRAMKIVKNTRHLLRPLFCVVLAGGLSLTSVRAERNVFVEGNVGASFSGDIIRISLNPIVNYRFTPYLSTGVGVIYQYYKTSKLSTSIYGANIPVYLNIFRMLSINMGKMDIYLHAEQQFLNTENQYFKSPFKNTGRSWTAPTFVGVRVTQNLGRATYISLSAMWRLGSNEVAERLYSTPLIRIGIGF